MKNEQTASELAKRYVLLIVGLFFSALGVAFTKHGELGVSPISSVANVLSLKVTAFSLGNWLIIWNCVLILGQILVLRRRFQPIQFLQIPLSFVFGWFTDLGMRLVGGISADTYPLRLVMIFVGTIVLGFGIALSVKANVIMNSGEAFVKAVSDTVHKEFGNVKIVFDVSCVAAAVILSMFLFEWSIKGTREGTLIAALCTGWVVKFFSPRLERPVQAILRS